MIRFYYEQTPDEGGELVEFTERVNLSDRAVHVTTNAEQASVGANTLVVDDPDGIFSMGGHRKVLVIEDDAPAGNQLIGWFYTAERKIGRQGAPVQSSRKWTVSLTDINTIIGRKVMAGDDTDRPEETDVERIQWLLGTAEAGVEFDDITTYVSTADPVNMSDSNYNGQSLQSIIDDCAQQSGKNYYMRWIWDGYDYISAFWYGDDGEESAVSTLRISNVIEEVDNVTTWAASEDAVLTRDPSRVFSGAFGNFDGGWNYRTNAPTIAEFANRDTVTSWPNVRKVARANARGDRYLAGLDTEEDTVTVSILVPPENVNDAHAGDDIRLHMVHMPGYSFFRRVRSLSRTVTFVTPEWYQIDYTLSPSDGADIIGEIIDGFLCDPLGWQVPLAGSDLNQPMTVTINGALGAGTGDSLADFGEYCVLYGGATYLIHTFDATFIGAQPLTVMWSNINNSSIYHGELGSTDCNFVPGHTAYCPPLTSRTDSLVWPGPAGVPADAIARASYLPWSGHNPQGSSWYVVITYVSGPDPRFEGLPGCPEP